MTLSKEIDTFNVIRFTEEWTVYWDPRVKGSKGLWIVFIMDLFDEREGRERYSFVWKILVRFIPGEEERRSKIIRISFFKF